MKVSEGCDHKCAFCIIPKIRGRHQSRPLGSVLEEAAGLVADGAVEINLIAQDLTAYGRDLRDGTSLALLLRRLGEIQGLRWIRLLYTYPNFVGPDLLAASRRSTGSASTSTCRCSTSAIACCAACGGSAAAMPCGLCCGASAARSQGSHCVPR
jgi:radical SAM superfamily enzyme YgiQ (UPF0313 family)